MDSNTDINLEANVHVKLLMKKHGLRARLSKDHKALDDKMKKSKNNKKNDRQPKNIYILPVKGKVFVPLLTKRELDSVLKRKNEFDKKYKPLTFKRIPNGKVIFSIVPRPLFDKALKRTKNELMKRKIKPIDKKYGQGAPGTFAFPIDDVFDTTNIKSGHTRIFYNPHLNAATVKPASYGSLDRFFGRSPSKITITKKNDPHALSQKLIYESNFFVDFTDSELKKINTLNKNKVKMRKFSKLFSNNYLTKNEIKKYSSRWKKWGLNPESYRKINSMPIYQTGDIVGMRITFPVNKKK